MGKPDSERGRPLLHAVPPPARPSTPDVVTPEIRMFRKLQTVITALSAADLPTLRVRAGLRDAMRQAVDAYVTEKLAERVAERANGASGQTSGQK